MAMLSVSCRLKTAACVPNVNELLRSALNKANTETGRTFLTSNSGPIGLDRGEGDAGRGHRSRNTKDVSSHESWSRKLLNGESVSVVSSSKDVYSNDRDGCVKTVGHLERKAFLSNKGSPVPLEFTLPMMRRSWTFSKELGPSTGRSFSFARKLSNSSNMCFSMSNPERSSSRKEDLCRRTSFRGDFCRRFSSKETSCKNTSQSNQCHNRKTKREDPKDCSDSDVSSKLSAKEFYPECSEPCEPSVEDPSCQPRPPPVRSSPKFYSPCPNVEDYCPKQEFSAEKLWRSVSIFIALPMVLVMSIYVYSKRMQSKNEPRPEFVDVPYMRRIVKPFPWGDGRHTLFHNPLRNPISPHGYEVEDPNEVKKSQPKD